MFQTKHNYTNTSGKYQALRTGSKLKEVYLVCYADDIKLFCKKKQDAEKIYIAVKKWLKERLLLEISPEKSKVTDVRKQASEFLEFTIKVFKIRNKWIATHSITKTSNSGECTGNSLCDK